MSTTVRRAVLTGAVATMSASFAAACLPDRSNPNDPALRPRAVLEVASGPYESEACGPIDSVTETLNRARCLHLLADGSSDPQDDILSYAFAILDSAGNAVAEAIVDVPADGPAPEPQARFSPEVLRALPGGLYTARVDVSDRAGHAHQARTSVVLENARPIAAQPGPRRIDHFAPAWAPGTEMVVPVSGVGGYDPDGDPILYCWKSVGLAASPTAPVEILDADGHCYEDPWLRITVDTDLAKAGHVLLEHWITDGGGESEKHTFGAIALGALPGWAFEEATGRAKVLDVNRRIFPIQGVSETLDLRFTGAPETAVVFAAGWNDELHRFQAAAGGPGVGPGAVSVATGVDRILGVHAPQSGGLVWMTSAQGDLLQVHVFAENTLLELDWFATNESLCSQDVPLGGVDAGGTLWIGQMLCGEVRGFRYDAQQGVIEEVDPGAFDATAPGEFLTSVALRPSTVAGASEVWAVYGPDVLSGMTGRTWARVRLPDGTVVPRVEFEPEVPIGFSLSFFIRREAWINDFTEGMSLFECVGCEPGGNPSGTWPPPGETPRLERVRVAEGTSAGFLTAVQPSGTVVFASTERYRIERVSLDGSMTGQDTVTRVEDLLGPDPGGAIWASLSVTGTNGAQVWLARGDGTGIEGVVQEIPVPLGFADPTVDYATGDLWTGAILPYPGAARIYLDGRQADLIRAISDGTASTKVGPPVVVASDPDTGNLWMVRGTGVGGDSPWGNEVFLADPYAPRLVAGTAMAPAGVSVPVIGPSDLGAVEQIIRAIPQVVPGAALEHGLVLMTMSEQPLLASGECAGAPAADTAHVYLRRYVLETDTLGAPVCLVGSYDIQGGGDTPALSRDLATGEICAGARRDEVGNSLARIVRYKADLTERYRAEPTANVGSAHVEGLAAAPGGQCWAAVMLDGTRYVGVLDPSGITPSDPGAALPASTTVRPVIGAAEAQGLALVSEAWIGGGESGDVPELRRVRLVNGQPELGPREDAFPTPFEVLLLQP